MDGQIIDEQGNIIGTISDDGQAIGLDNQVLGVVETVLVDSQGKVMATQTQVVRDAEGNIIGKIVDGKIIDEQGNVIGTVDELGNAISVEGEVLGVIDTVMVTASGEIIDPTSTIEEDITTGFQRDYVDFISGGTGENGIIPVIRVRKQ